MINFSSTEKLSNLIELEKVSLESTLDIQKNFNKQILIFVKKFMADIDISSEIDSNNEAFFYLNEATSILNKSNSNINSLKDLLNTLSQINSFDEHLQDLIKNYNCSFKEIMNSVYANTEIIQKFLFKISVETPASTTISATTATPVAIATSATTSASAVDVVKNKQSTTSATFATNTTSATLPTQYVENTLVISETQKKVILPYNLNKITDILQNNKRYHSIKEIVDKLYTIPISYYKFSSISRFKEAYKLVKNREKGSRFKALSLAFELFGNYSLHPAIITACKSLDELDIYLACLDENDLEDFKFFNIKYEVPLAISK